MALSDSCSLPTRGTKSRMRAPVLPPELIQTIVEKASLKDSINITYALGYVLTVETKHKIIASRYDVKRYLRELTDDPTSLLLAMLYTKTVLSGSRGSSYFEPALVSSSSDWDFFTCLSPVSILGFMLYLRTIGVIWTEKTHDYTDSRSTIEYDNDLEVVRGTIERRGKIHNVSIIFNIVYYVTASRCIIEFHSSAVQCFISGFAAVSLYSGPTSHGKSLRWGKIAQNDMLFDEYNQKAVDKYVTRGIEYITYEKYAEEYSKAGPLQVTSAMERPRHAADSEAHVVSLVKIFEKMPHRRHAKKCLESLQSISWSEFPYMLRGYSIPSDTYVRAQVPKPTMIGMRLPLEVLDEDFTKLCQRTLRTNDSDETALKYISIRGKGAMRSANVSAFLYPC